MERTSLKKIREMKHTAKDYSKILNGRLPSSSLEFELADRLLELEELLEDAFEAGKERQMNKPYSYNSGYNPNIPGDFKT